MNNNSITIIISILWGILLAFMFYNIVANNGNTIIINV